jgi:hypothetical protein
MAKKNKRNTLLTTWLIIMLVANILTALFYLFFNSLVASMYPSVAPEIFYVYSILSITNSVLVIFLFDYKKWAFFAFCITALIAFVMNLIIGLDLLSTSFGLLGPVILYLIMRPQWKLFK